MAFEIIHESFPNETAGLYRRYDVMDRDVQPPIGTTIFVEDTPQDKTTFTSGRIVRGSDLAFNPAKGFENVTDIIDPRQARRPEDPIVFRGPSLTAIVVIMNEVADPTERRQRACVVAAYVTQIALATAELERACPPFGVAVTNQRP